MKNTWKVINSIIRSKTKTYSERFVTESSTYTCPKQISAEFNRYFANIWPSLASTIQHTGKDFSSYMQISNNKSCFFRPTSADEIIKVIGKLGKTKVQVTMGLNPILLSKLQTK